MTIEQEEHMYRVEDEFRILLRNKYKAGQAEHGGNLWEKPGMIDMALEEVVDLAVYLLTLKEQSNG